MCSHQHYEWPCARPAVTVYNEQLKSFNKLEPLDVLDDAERKLKRRRSNQIASAVNMMQVGVKTVGTSVQYGRGHQGTCTNHLI
jgi:hypothetical protein